MSVLPKKTKTPRKTQKNNNLKNTKCQQEGAQFLHLACQGGRLDPLPPVSYATASYTTTQKCPMLRQQPQRMPFVSSHGQVYCDNFHNRLSADFLSRVLVFTEYVFPWSLNETTNYIFILPGKTSQHHLLETRSANVWALVQSDQSPFIKTLFVFTGFFMGSAHHKRASKVANTVHAQKGEQKNAFSERREYWVTCYVRRCVNMWMVCAQPDGSMSSLLQSTGSSPYVLVHIVGPLAATLPGGIALKFCAQKKLF